jgi:hypothetical protein
MDLPPLSSAEFHARTRALLEWDDTVSGIPTMTAGSTDAREIRQMDSEELCAELADSIEFGDSSVENDDTATVLRAMLSQEWILSEKRSRGLMINFTQRILGDMGLRVVRKNG